MQSIDLVERLERVMNVETKAEQEKDVQEQEEPKKEEVKSKPVKEIKIS